MPSPMIHLLVAHQYYPDAPGEFWIGSFMPDFTNERQRKDFIHLRDVSNRWDAMDDMSMKFDPENLFKEGWLLHLFTDVCWEEGPLKKYIERAAHSDWFHTYREQTKLASYWLYQNEDWADSVWNKIMHTPIEAADILQGPSIEEISWYREGVMKKHMENNTEPSTDFHPKWYTTLLKKLLVGIASGVRKIHISFQNEHSHP